MANMGDLTEQCEMLEFGINQRSTDMLDAILERAPRIVGFGVYIWNVEQTLRLVADLKAVYPEVIVILGGPEVSYETETQPICELADCVLTGEADLTLPDVCRNLLANESLDDKVIHSPTPQMTEVMLPYDLYTDRDIAERVIYVEASRGCPYTCEFCLSALEIPVRQVPLQPFLNAMQSLLDRGASSFKFVDRTFNLNLRVSKAILEFFLERYRPGLFLHFEMIPDRLPESLREVISRFPEGALQFEVGVQTFNPHVSEFISRRQDNDKLAQNLAFLREETGVHIHADLIVGLPGETIESFADGFDRLVAMKPQEIQVGILKRLRGTPIIRHDDEWQMVYSPNAPYEILKNKLLTAADVSQLRRFARFWDSISNSGNFVETGPMIWSNSTPFAGFRKLCDWLFDREGQMHGLSLIRLAEAVFEFLTTEDSHDAATVAPILLRDYQRAGRRDIPHFLRKWLDSGPATSPAANETSRRGHTKASKRQSRHLGRNAK